MLVAITLLAGILRLVRIGAQSLWVDEMLTLTVATPKPGYPLDQLLLHNIHGPLHTFVVSLMRMVSENDGWLRMPSALAGTLTVPLLYAWVRPRFGARAAGWAALLLAVNPLHLHYSQELRNYAFAVFFVMAGCVQLDRVCSSWSLARAAGFAACVAAAVLSNFSSCFAFLVQSLVFLRAQPTRRRALGRWATIAAMVVLATSPWIYRVTTYVDFGKLVTPVRPGELAQAERLRGDTTFRVESIPYTFYAYSVGFSLGPTLAEMHGDLQGTLARHRVSIAWTAVVFGTLSLLGIRRATRREHGGWRALEPALYVAVPLVVTLLLNWQNAKAFNVRYVLVGLPMYLSLVGLGIGGWASRRAALAAGTLVLGTSVVALDNYYTDPARWKEDVRGATRAIEARLAPGECIFAPTVFQLVEHYQTTAAPLHWVYRGGPITERQFQDLFASCPSFWYLRARPWVDDADGYVLSTIESRYRRDAVMEFPGVTALHFVPKN